ncbi:MAG: hypothetical protein HYY94_01240 [Gemmatimonadetes bacterium]|nr:hypothetical protein [Gemmatimonadota bacterium]
MILTDASAAELQSLGPAVHAWVKAGHPPPLIFPEQGWRASTDVFPMEIEDMRQAHRVLLGRHVLRTVSRGPPASRHRTGEGAG